MRSDEKKISIEQKIIKDCDMVEPNCISIEVKEGQFIFHFGEIEKQDHSENIRVVSEVMVNDAGVKAILRQLLNSVNKYEKTNDRNLLKEMIEEVNKNEAS